MTRLRMCFCAVAFFLMPLPVCLAEDFTDADAPTLQFNFENAKLGAWQQIHGLGQALVRPTESVGPAAQTAETGKFLMRTWPYRAAVVESPVFELLGAEMTFLLGGTGGPRAYAALHDISGEELLRADVPVLHSSKGDPWKLTPVRWDVSQLKGRRAFLRLTAEPVGYSIGKKPGSNATTQDSFVVFDAFQTRGRIDWEATDLFRVRRETKKNASLDKVAAQLDEIIFAVRKIDRDGHWYANIGHWSGDPERKLFHDGAKLCRLNTKTGQLIVLLEDAKGGIRDPQVHYDGRKILFSYRPGGTEYYHLYEINADGTDMHRLTDGTYDDIEPTYMPDGRIMFVSTRCKRWVPCYFTEVATLHSCDGDGKNIRVLSSNVEHENTPWPLPDGRLMYTRWEYVERSVLDFHHLWTTNPDGTRQTVYYGNSRPSYVMIDGKPIPDTQMVACVFCPAHGRTEHAGTITVVDPSLGPDEKTSVRNVGWTYAERDPYPIGRDGFLLASYANLQVMDYEGNVRTIFTLSKPEVEEKFYVHEPRPLVARPREKVIPQTIRPEAKNGLLFLTDIYHGRNMKGIEPGSIKKLLVLEYLPKSLNMSNGSEPTSTESNNLERILGTVPVEEDGSAYFEAPALRTIFLAALDENDMSVKRMQSFLTVQPGETTGCVGCHEHRTQTPMPKLTMAMSRGPSQIEPIEDVPSVFDFPRDVQPILDRHCVACHDWKATEEGGPWAGRVILSSDHGPVYSHSYSLLMSRLVHLSRGPGSGVGNHAPYEIGSSGSRLMKYLDGSHHGAKLSEHEQKMIRCWIDSGAIYAGTNAAEGTGMIYSQIGRQTNRYKVESYAWFSMGDRWEPSLAAAREVVDRRCNDCHQHSLPELDLTRDMQNFVRPKPGMRRVDQNFAVNLTRPELSLLVLGPLSKEAGGYDRCSRETKVPVFKDKHDADYKILRDYLDVLHDAQNRNKRFNMPGFKPSEHYVREMKRYGIIPESFDREKDEIDVYEADEAYWRSFWWKPDKEP
jgi:hypothetical protein